MNIYEFIAREFGMNESVNVIEIGAHIGTDTIELAKFIGNGKMTSFEPDPRNIPILRRRIKKNGLPVKLIEMAVGAIQGTAEFRLSSGIPPYNDKHIVETQEHTASSSLKSPKNHLERFPWVKFDDLITVQVTTLDKFFGSRKEIIDIVWADVQGAELDMIDGGQETLARTRFLFTEFNDNEMYEGQAGLSEIIKRLPGEWGLALRFGDEVLLQNKAYGHEWVCDSHAQQCWDVKFRTSDVFPLLIQQGRSLAADFLTNAAENQVFNNVLFGATSLLEVGCGSGELVHLVKIKYPNLTRIMATDCSMGAIQHGIERYGADARFRIHDARNVYLFENEKFDLSITSCMLQHFKNPFLPIDNMLEVSKSCIVIVPYMQPVTDGYDDEGGIGHVFMFTDATFEKYNIISKICYASKGWQYSSKGEPPLLMAILLEKKL